MLRLVRLFLRSLAATVRHRFSSGPLRPSWSFGFELLVRYLRADWEETADWPPARLRADLDARPYPTGELRHVRFDDRVVGGVPVCRVHPRDGARPGLILFLHGGSYVYGSCRTTHADLVARLSRRAGREVVGVEYRLAPEHPYPAQLEDARAVYDALLADGVRSDQIVVAGDSAGGNLAIALAVALRDASRPVPRALILLSPWSDLTMPGASFTSNDAYDFGTRAVLALQAQAFSGGMSLDDARLSPVYADLARLPPTLLAVGEAEIPRDDIEALALRLSAAGVEVTRRRAVDMPHNAALFAAYHPEGAATLEAVVRFIGAQLPDSE